MLYECRISHHFSPCTIINDGSACRRFCEYTKFSPHANHMHPPDSSINSHPSMNPRGCSLTPNGNTNQQRLLLAESISITSSLDYVERMETQSTNASWTDQVNIEDNIFPPPPNQLQDQSGKIEVVISHTPLNLPQPSDDNTVSLNSSIELSVIPYQINSSTDPNLWDGKIALILLLSVNKFLNGNAKNISCSLQRMAIFIKQCLLVTRNIYQFPQLVTEQCQRQFC